MITKIQTSGLLIIGVLGLMIFSPNIISSQELTVESNHSTIQFIVPISNGITRITGKFTDYIIDVDYNEEDFTKSKLRAIIKATSINTGIADRDNHLRTSDFFDVEKYPEISFASEAIIKSGDHYKMQGQFTMHGVTKAIEIPIRITGKDSKNTIGFSSRFIINRLDYGVAADFKHSSIENFISEDIAVEIDFWTKKKKVKKD